MIRSDSINKIIIMTLTSALFCLFLLPTPSLAQTANAKKIGEACTANSQCQTNQCQSSNLNVADKTFCTCQTAQDCENAYGKTTATETFTCKPGVSETNQLNYCQSNVRGDLKAVDGEKILNDANLATGQANQQKPVTVQPPKINIPIPELPAFQSFQVTPGQVVNLPWIAQYLAAAFKYAIQIAGVLAILAFLVGGFLYITAGARPAHASEAKSIMLSSVLGLIIILSSYLVLTLINPRLTEFTTITPEVLSPEELLFGQEIEEHAQGAGAESGSGEGSVNCENKTIGSKAPAIAGMDYTYMDKESLKCHTYKNSRSLSSISKVILHDGGNTSGIVNYWRRKCNRGDSCISSHYSISRGGTIYQLVGEDRIAAHAGSQNTNSIGIDLEPSLRTSFLFNNSSIDRCLEACKNGYYTTSKGGKITSGWQNCGEFNQAVNKCTPSFTPQQYAALNRLLSSIESRTSVSRTTSSIQGHCAFAHSDPRNFDWSKIGLDNTSAGSVTSRANSACSFPPTWDIQVPLRATIIFSGG